MGILEDIFGMAQGPDQMQKRRLFGALNRMQAVDDTPGAMIQRALMNGEGQAAPMPKQSSLGAAPMPTPATASPSAPPSVPVSAISPSAKSQMGGSGYTADRLGAFARGYSSGGLIGAIADATGGADRQEDSVNQTYQFLVRKGLPEADARAVVQNPQLMQQVLPRLIGPKSDDRKYMQVNGRIVEIGPDGAKELYAAPDGGRESVKYGTTLNYTDDGKPFVAGTDGTVRFPEFPEGVKPLAPGQLAENKAKGAATGKAMGEAKAALPKVIQTTSETIAALDDLSNDPDLDRNLGAYGGRAWDVSPSSNRVAEKIAQIGGKAFLTAFQSLRGGGAITEIEGQKATQAVSRLNNRKQSPEDYRAAIKELRDISRNGMIRARVDAGELGPEALSQLRDFENVEDLTAPAPAAAPAQSQTMPRGAPSSGAPVGTQDVGDGFKVRVK